MDQKINQPKWSGRVEITTECGIVFVELGLNYYLYWDNCYLHIYFKRSHSNERGGNPRVAADQKGEAGQY